MPATQNPPLIFDGEPEEFTRKVSVILREVLLGKTNNTLDITLEPGVEETVITRPRVCCETRLSLLPKSASAAQALASGTLWYEAHYERIVIHHDASDATDRVFGATLVG